MHCFSQKYANKSPEATSYNFASNFIQDLGPDILSKDMHVTTHANG